MEFFVRIALNRGRSTDQSPSPPFVAGANSVLLGLLVTSALRVLTGFPFRTVGTVSLCEFPPTILAVGSHALVCRPRSLTTPSWAKATHLPPSLSWAPTTIITKVKGSRFFISSGTISLD